MADRIAKLRAKAEQLVAIGDHVKNQWRASEWQRTQCLDNAPLVAKALLLALEQRDLLNRFRDGQREWWSGEGQRRYCDIEDQLAALVKGES